MELVGTGRARAVLVVGGIADASVRRSRARRDGRDLVQAAPWSQGSGDPSTRRPWGLTSPEGAAGLAAPVTIFSLIESVFAATAGRSFAEQRRWLGHLMAPFTAVAARRPELAWFPVERTPVELATVTLDNRIIDEPYTKRMTSFPTVDQSAAILVTSSGLADRCGVPVTRRVHPLAVAAVKEGTPPSLRRRMDRSGALAAAVDRAFASAGRTVDQVARVDLYSCFPAAVQLGAAAFGLGLDDPRGLTVTGGLPYFGGPGPCYVLHSLACMVEECRADAGSLGAVGGLGGLAGDMAVGLLSTEPGAGTPLYHRGEDVTAALVADAVPFDPSRSGEATVVAMTLSVGHDGVPWAAPAIVEFPDGVRSGAAAGSAAAAADLAGTSLVGGKVRVELRDGNPVYETI